MRTKGYFNYVILTSRDMLHIMSLANKQTKTTFNRYYGALAAIGALAVRALGQGEGIETWLTDEEIEKIFDDFAKKKAAKIGELRL